MRRFGYYWKEGLRNIFKHGFMSIAAIAIIVGAVRFIGWRVQVNEALTAQSQSQSQYDFNPGNIISDGTFFNGNALSEQQVSTIIEQQGVACSGERCLKSMTFSTESQSADEYCQAYDGGPNESAAAIVYKATWPDQRVFRTTIAGLEQTAKDNGISKTALITVGGFLGDTYERSKLYDPTFAHGCREASK